PDDLRGRLRPDLPARGAQLGGRSAVDAEQHPVLGRDGHRRDAAVRPQGRLRARPLQRRGRGSRQVLFARADPEGEGRTARLRQVPGGAWDLTTAQGAPREKSEASWSLPLAMWCEASTTSTTPIAIEAVSQIRCRLLPAAPMCGMVTRTGSRLNARSSSTV